jgi:hypothetical protein
LLFLGDSLHRSPPFDPSALEDFSTSSGILHPGL